MRLFLDEIYDRRIKVLNFITASRKEVTISEIAKATGLVKGQYRSLLSSLNKNWMYQMVHIQFIT
ncbi:helix-turn-helix domain-containing protein [Enterococcus termitis]